MSGIDDDVRPASTSDDLEHWHHWMGPCPSCGTSEGLEIDRTETTVPPTDPGYCLTVWWRCERCEASGDREFGSVGHDVMR